MKEKTLTELYTASDVIKKMSILKKKKRKEKCQFSSMDAICYFTKCEAIY